MPGFLEDGITVATPAPLLPDFTVIKQSVDFEVDFVKRTLRGSTEITLQPQTKDLKHVRLHCRQCRPLRIQMQGMNAQWEYDDPHRRLRMPAESTVHQHEMLKHKIDASIGPSIEPQLSIALPPRLKLQELHIDPITAVPQYPNTPSLQKQESDAMAILETPTALTAGQGPQFAPVMLYIEFEVEAIRDGLHWTGIDDSDKRYPCVYTLADLAPGRSSCIFPCVDDATTRCSWDFSIKCPKTIGDAFRRDGVSPEMNRREQYHINLTEEDAARDLTVLCVGEQTSDMTDSEDETRRTVSFSLIQPVTARHVGFAIGPFEHVDLGALRDADDEERLGQNAIKISGYCLPSRAEELRNTAMPMHLAVDWFGINYGGFPFTHYQMLFVDDLIHNTVPLAGLSLCSSRLLFGSDILEPLTRNTRILVRAVADQWMGVNVIAKESNDAWVIAGIAGFMSDLFGRRLFGNNEYRWAQKIAAERVYDLDADRPSIHQLGSLVHIDPSIREFIDLKSALVLFILDRRLMKASSSTGVTRIINKICLSAKSGSLLNGELSTADFQRTCEKLGHNKLDSFFRQWIFGAGCPIFEIKQRFNKKKLVVEMTITQRQMERRTKPEFAPSNFMREIKEHVQEVWAPETQAVFTGPMTIRIHEADGTPYEHIVEIKEQITKLEIPYNTKYKRLKRSRRQRERAIAASGNNNSNNDPTDEGGNDALLYCLGDILDSAQEIDEWNLKDWSPEDEEKMGQESYEWIRMDADFEWIGRIHLWLPVYMYVSQLQQDRDLAAQYDSVKYIESCGPHHVSLSILVRTLMDQRYFHGIRTMAANAIATIARDNFRDIGRHHLEKAFSTLFCVPGSIMPKPNDWSSRVTFILQCAIPEAMARLRDAEGKVPMQIRRVFVDKLRFNDNSNNDFSDAHYIAVLMSCLADSLAVSHREVQQSYHFDFGGGDDIPMDTDNADTDFEKEAVGEIKRYRKIDEWISTYQNIYSITALNCLQKLTKAGIVKNRTRELLMYTRRTNAADVRLAAYRCLNEIGTTRGPITLKYLLHELADDASPYFRDRLLALYGEALGHIALDDEEPIKRVIPANTDADLVLEQEVSAEVRQLETTRKTTPEGALAALKQYLLKHDVCRDALWYAITSPTLNIVEISALLDIASLIYDAKTSYMVKLRLPRPWKAQHIRNGVVKFYAVGEYRTKPRKPLSMEDWQMLNKRGLKYEGPVPEEAKAKPVIDEEAALRLQIAALKEQQQRQQQAATVKESDAFAMPPPSAVADKTGLKLSLKRKQSSTMTPREESPKQPKLSKSQSPSLERRSSIATLKKSGARKIVVLNLGLSASRRAAQILALPSKNLLQGAAAHSTIANGISNPPGSVQTSPMPQGTSQNEAIQPSPAPQAPALNPGAFRSYGPPVDTSAYVAPKKEEEEDVKPDISQLNGTSILEQGQTTSPEPLHHPSVEEPERRPSLKISLKFRRSQPE